MVSIKLFLVQACLSYISGRKSADGCISVVPFIEGLVIYKCDNEGVRLQVYDLEVTVPLNALPLGVTVHIEIGVALYGPFKFPKGCQPVSPILWFCTDQDTDFLLPITFKLPHCLLDSEEVKLSFAKADHLEQSKEFSFKSMDASPTVESAYEMLYGTISSKHHCFLCIQAESTSSKELALKRGYCLHLLTRKVDPFMYQIIIVCTYFLETCVDVSVQCLEKGVPVHSFYLQALKEMYPEVKGGYEHIRKQRFQFEDGSTPHLEVLPSTEDEVKIIEEDKSKVRSGTEHALLATILSIIQGQLSELRWKIMQRVFVMSILACTFF